MMVIIYLMQLIVLHIVLLFDEIKYKRTYLLNLIPFYFIIKFIIAIFYFIIEFVIAIKNKLKYLE